MAARTMNTLAAIRQLSCLGLPAKSALPEAIGLLRRLVGFDMEVGMHVDQDCRLLDAHVPPHVSLAALREYATHYYDRGRGAAAVGWTTRQALQSGLAVIHSSRIVARGTLERSELWNRVLRPYDMGWYCQVPVRDGPRPLACLVLARPFTQRDYGARELQLLALAQPWLCHALAQAPVQAPVPGPAAPEAAETGVLVADAGGRVLHASRGVLQLLHLAVGAPLASSRLHQAARAEVDALLRRLTRAVFAAAAGRDTAPPAGGVHNAHGFFRWRAYALDADAQGVPAQVALQVERRLPLAAQLFRAPRFLALSARERDVCLGLAAGRSSTEIAAGLGIKPSSVIHYTRSLYRRLNVSQARELLPALL